MRLNTTLRGSALLAASATALATLAFAPAASAAPVFTDADTVLDPSGGVFAGGGTCTAAPVINAGADVPVVENGPAAAASASVSATFANTADATDNGAFTASTSATGQVTSAGGNPKTFDFSAQGSYALTSQLPASACDRGGYSAVDLDFTFTVSQAGFLNLTFKNSGGTRAYGEVYLYQVGSGDNPYIDHYGWGLKFNNTTKVLLPPGQYSGFFEGENWVDQETATSGTSSTTVHGQFNVAGSQTQAVSGKGKKYVTLPAARSCATHTLGASITGKKKRADQIKQVTVFVNDHKVKKVKTPDKGDAVTLPIADEDTADVVALVKLFPRKKGKPGKVVEVSASYEACS
jgi:hypothetical protein